ncbi:MULTISPECIES: cell division protein FtsZ [Larkinella]|uniref:Cell division protein FtsZ n=1 Tax=Larkinella humicola TaxID=2607654 RepID=A0A5N1JLW2_9BACT|nr:cell division protein FtsZ [Larkinella humicola]KAA9353954.1 cell division protein FtsZ [Larkinella humicola]
MPEALEYGMRFEFPDEEDDPIIKVIGVGGGGSNAVNHMFRMGVKDVDFIVCNTDRQSLTNSPVKTKIQLGALLTSGLGAGTNPEVGRQAALENTDDIRQLLGEPTKMVFITAGMGGGTGTGAAPVIAQIAREMGLLTIAVVTAPFDFEGIEKLDQAMRGIEELKEYCDTVLVILNDKLAEIFEDFPMDQAFAKADDVLANAVKSIAEIITVQGEINVDFMDVKRVLEGAGQAVMGSADAEGETRALTAIQDALNSPLLNDRDIRGAKRILLTMASGPDARTTMRELQIITGYIKEKIGKDKQAHLFKYGTIKDKSLGKNLRVTVIAAGFDLPAERPDFPPTNWKQPEPELKKEEVTDELPVDEEEDTELVTEDQPQGADTLTRGGGNVEVAPIPDPVTRPHLTSIDDILIDEKREDDLLLIQKMVEGFSQGRYSERERELETPAFARQKVNLYEIPLLDERDIIRTRLND